MKVDVGIAGDVRTVLAQLLPGVKPQQHPGWIARIRDWQEDGSERDILNQEVNGKLLGAQVINDLWKFTGGNAWAQVINRLGAMIVPCDELQRPYGRRR